MVRCGDGDRTSVTCEELDQISTLMERSYLNETGEHLGEWNQNWKYWYELIVITVNSQVDGEITTNVNVGVCLYA